MAAAASATISGCSGDIGSEPPPIHDFRLGFATVGAKGAVAAPASRTAEPAELEEALQSALEERLGRYKGIKYYHVAVAIEGYSLGAPGVPLVVSPKSALFLRVSVWDDAAGVRLEPQSHRITVTEQLSPVTVIGSGLLQTKEEQIENLSESSAKVIEDWLKSDEGPISMAVLAKTQEVTEVELEATPEDSPSDNGIQGENGEVLHSDEG